METYRQCEQLRDRIFHHPCSELGSGNGYSYSSSDHDEFEVHYDMGDDWRDMSNKRVKGPSCNALRDECMHDALCETRLKQFRKSCKVRRGKCQAETREECIQAYENLRYFGLFQCSCENHIGLEREKCHALRRRLQKNMCLVVANKVAKVGRENNVIPQKPGAVEAVIDTAAEDEDGILSKQLMDEPDDDELGFTDCREASEQCNSYFFCRRKLTALISNCEGTSSKPCNRKACLSAMSAFYHNVALRNAHAIAFCGCIEGDAKCESLRQSLHPQCSTADVPTPSCQKVVQTCQEDTGCRKRWQNYKHYCGSQPGTGLCVHGTQLCRDAVVGISGTALSLNCTCSNTNPEHALNKWCLDHLDNINNNKCRERALKEIMTRKRLQLVVLGERQYAIPPPYISISAEVCSSLWNATDDEKHMVRVYSNGTGSDCSSLCNCLPDEKMVCRYLPCPPPEHCREGKVVYGHGSVFSSDDRGTCHCDRGEIICAKGYLTIGQSRGLFLYIGYSQNDKLIMETYGVPFDYELLARRLVHHLNLNHEHLGCGLRMISAYPGNFIFKVLSSKTRIRQIVPKECIFPAMMLCHLINSNDVTLTTDPLLSTLRAAAVDVLRNMQNSDPNSVLTGQVVHNSASTEFSSFRTSIIVVLLCSFYAAIFERPPPIYPSYENR
ncbi:uncharacterized protein LOC141912985 [Tubulanus polymorphus]|uniref:uncharacterized protein LOC141912985 n=1 Tax=Tubulanus polymorphus TaxID=672921 RepID=UPI003DA3F2CF